MEGLTSILVLLAAIGVFTHRRFGGTDVTVNDGTVTVTPRGADKLWSLRTKVDFPLAALTDVRVDDRSSVAAGWKLPGTCVPGWIISGRYVRKGEWSFWNVHRAEWVLVLEVDDGPFARIVVEVDDPVATARMVMAASPNGLGHASP